MHFPFSLKKYETITFSVKKGNYKGKGLDLGWESPQQAKSPRRKQVYFAI